MSLFPIEGQFVEACAFGVCAFLIVVMRVELICNVVLVQVYGTVLQVMDKPKQTLWPTKY